MNLTKKHLMDTMETQLSSCAYEKYTITDLTKTSKMSRSTIYYHFDCIEDIYLYLFENTVIRKVMLECTNYDEVIVSTIDYILANKILCLNLYHLTTLMNRQDYLLGILSASFHRFELPLNTPLLTENYLMGGFLFVMTTWLDGKMVTDKKIVIQQLHDYGNIVKTHLTI